FFQAHIGQKRFLHVLPLCCFLFSRFSSAIIIMNVLHYFMSFNVFSVIILSYTSFSIKLANTTFLRFFFVELFIISCFFLFFGLYLLIQFKKFKYHLVYE